MASGGFEDVDALLSARELIIGCNAIEAVRARARHHRDLAVEALAVLPESDSKMALVTLASYLTEPNQNRQACPLARNPKPLQQNQRACLHERACTSVPARRGTLGLFWRSGLLLPTGASSAVGVMC